MRLALPKNFAAYPTEVHFYRILPDGFSREDLHRELVQIAAQLPETKFRDRTFIDSSAGGESIRGESVRRDWDLSRYALLEAFRALRASGIDIGKDAGRIRYSLSHTAGASIAVVALAEVDSGPNVGVDLECSTREISDAAFRRFSHEGEETVLPDRLGQWVLKESCVKASFHTGQVLVTRFKISRNCGDGEFEIVTTDGNLDAKDPERFQGFLFSHDEFRIGIARGKST